MIPAFLEGIIAAFEVATFIFGMPFLVWFLFKPRPFSPAKRLQFRNKAYVPYGKFPAK